MVRRFSKPVFVLVAALVACGPQDEVQRTEVKRDTGTFRAGLNVGQAGGCSTTIVQGLTEQLVEELNCVAPNLMVDFSGPNVNLYSAVQPYLAPSAANAIKSAAISKNDVISISSAYRSLAQQYLLYKWWQAGQCGIQAAAVPGTSNHQSGRAVDIPSYSYWKTALQSKGWTWFGNGDLVHFDYLAAPNVSSKSILAFQKLWNKNHPTNKLTEDSTWGPSTQAAMAASPTTGFPIHGCVSTGKLVGYIFEKGSATNRVLGAVVKVGTHSVTTGADGKYVFVLAPGAYSVSVTKSGYTSNQVSRTVAAGGTVWGSMEINAVATTGTLEGAVFTNQGGTMGPALAGALVSAGGKSATTGAAGTFSLTLPAGTYSLSVSKSGFEKSTSARTVKAGAKTVANVGLVPAMVDGPPSITIEDPATDGLTDFARVKLSGSASDDGGPLAKIQVALNAEPVIDAPVEQGVFAVELKLRPGANSVTVTATDGAGTSSSATWTGTFRSGLSGLVRRYDEPAAIIAGAVVTLTNAATGDQVATATTDAAGRFELDVTQLPGDFALSVKADGFVEDLRTMSLSDEARGTLDIGLTPGVTGVYSVRFIEPSPGASIDAEITNVSGVVEGLQLSSVKVNGVDAMLLGQSAFLAKVPVVEGHNVFEVVAESPEGHTVTATIEVDRPVAEAPLPAVEGKTGCAAVPSPALLVLVALAFVSRRRRFGRDGAGVRLRNTPLLRL